MNKKSSVALLIIAICASFIFISFFYRNQKHFSNNTIYVSNNTCEYIISHLLQDLDSVKVKYVNIGTCCEGDASSAIVNATSKQKPLIWAMANTEKTKGISKKVLSKDFQDITRFYNCDFHTTFNFTKSICLVDAIYTDLQSNINENHWITLEKNKRILCKKIKQSHVINNERKATIFVAGDISYLLSDNGIEHEVLITNIHEEPSVSILNVIEDHIEKQGNCIFIFPKNHLRNLSKYLKNANCEIIFYDLDSKDPFDSIESFVSTLNTHLSTCYL